MGHCTEWLHKDHLGKDLGSSIDDLTKRIVERSATENGRFSCKIFPPQLCQVYEVLGDDLIRNFLENHSVSLAVLRRRDRIRQAISLARGKMTGAFSSASEIRSEAEYDFDLICESYFGLERSNNFWKSYLDLLGLEHQVVYYEDMLESPRPCMEWIAERLEVQLGELPQSRLAIQRDATTDEWAERFQEDITKHDVIRHAVSRRLAFRSPSNLFRFLTKKTLKPYQV